MRMRINKSTAHRVWRLANLFMMIYMFQTKYVSRHTSDGSTHRRCYANMVAAVMLLAPRTFSSRPIVVTQSSVFCKLSPCYSVASVKRSSYKDYVRVAAMYVDRRHYVNTVCDNDNLLNLFEIMSTAVVHYCADGTTK